MPSFFTLESMERYGIPTVIDGNKITFMQGKVILRLIDKAMDEAKHPLDKAIEMAVECFRKMYSKTEEGWEPKQRIKQHNGYVRNRFYVDEMNDRRSKKMARGKAKPKNEESVSYLSLLESGARNNKKDKSAIREVIKHALSQLSKDDRLSALKELGYHIKEEGK